MHKQCSANEAKLPFPLHIVFSIKVVGMLLNYTVGFYRCGTWLANPNEKQRN